MGLEAAPASTSSHNCIGTRKASKAAGGTTEGRLPAVGAAAGPPPAQRCLLTAPRPGPDISRADGRLGQPANTYTSEVGPWEFHLLLQAESWLDPLDVRTTRDGGGRALLLRSVQNSSFTLL